MKLFGIYLTLGVLYRLLFGMSREEAVGDIEDMIRMPMIKPFYDEAVFHYGHERYINSAIKGLYFCEIVFWILIPLLSVVRYFLRAKKWIKKFFKEAEKVIGEGEEFNTIEHYIHIRYIKESGEESVYLLPLEEAKYDFFFDKDTMQHYLLEYYYTGERYNQDKAVSLMDVAKPVKILVTPCVENYDLSQRSIYLNNPDWDGEFVIS